MQIWYLYHLGIRVTHGSGTRLRDMARIYCTATSRGSRLYETLGDRLSMVYTGDEGQELFTSHAWRRGQEPEKVTGVDLFYLRSMDRGTANVPYLLAQYLFRHAKGRKSGTRLSGGHFIGCLTAHFGLVSDQGLRGLSVVTRELPLIDLHELGRLNICLRIGTSAIATYPQDYTAEDFQAQGGGAGVAMEHCRAVRRCC
ncbi:hypothetical protein Tco_1309181 [Tanacetum coccineum]